jgi:tRNA(Ile2) C34 agmatinyltransferase TiaS
MKLNIYAALDVDKLREANPRLKFTRCGNTLSIVAKCACPDCGEPMANGGACGYYCTNCDHDSWDRATAAAVRKARR